MYRLRHQRWRLIHINGITHYWMPFEHCVCVWDQHWTRGQHKQFARHDDQPVPLSEVAAFIQRVFHREPPPTDQCITLLARTRYYGLHDGKINSYGTAIMGSFTDPKQAVAEADRLNPAYVAVLQKMLKTLDYALPSDEPLPPDAERWRESVLRRGWLIYRAETVDMYDMKSLTW